jgi:hypothetical protein
MKNKIVYLVTNDLEPKIINDLERALREKGLVLVLLKEAKNALENSDNCPCPRVRLGDI